MNNKKQNLIIFSIILFFIVCSFAGTYFFLKKGYLNTKNETSQTESELEQTVNDKIENSDELTEEEKEVISNMDLDEKAEYMLGQLYTEYQTAVKIGDESKPEYPEEKSSQLYKRLISMAEYADYANIIKLIDDELVNYKFHEQYNWKIGAIYYDATVMMGTLTVPVEGQGQMVKNLKDPIMLAIGTLMIPEKSRRDVIINPESLTPIFSGSVDIVEIEENPEDDKIAQEIYNTQGSVRNVYKMTILLETTNKIYAYVYTTPSSSNFYRITCDEDANLPYRTINYWKSIVP